VVFVFAQKISNKAVPAPFRGHPIADQLPAFWGLSSIYVCLSVIAWKMVELSKR
jgi:hypothetical protein